MSASNDSNDTGRSPEQPAAGEPRESGHTGEGAASALAHMISQAQQHRHPSGDADDAAGGRRQ